MRLLTEEADVECTHSPRGRVLLDVTQNLVFVDDARVLVEPNPHPRPMAGCTFTGGPGIYACQNTISLSKGYSDLLFIHNDPVVIDSLTGKTSGGAPGTVDYEVTDAGQDFVEADA